MTRPAATSVDVAVIGGGLTGLAAAHFLLEGGCSVALVERGAVGGDPARGGQGGGATAAATSGLLCTGAGEHAARAAHGVGRAGAAAVVAFTEENRAIVEALAAGIDCGFARRGAYAIAVNAAERADLEATVALYEAEGVARGAALLGRDALASRTLAPAADAAIHYPDDAEVDPAALARGLAARLRSGAADELTLLERTRVSALETDRDGARLALEPAPGMTVPVEVRAAIVVIAANGWSCEVHPFFDRRVFPTRGQGLITAPLPPILAAPVHACWGHEMYRQRADGRLVACGFRPEPGPEETGFDDRPTDAFQGWLERFAAQRIPALAGRTPLAVERRFASTCGFSSDGLPLLGALPGQPAIVAACGFTMRGLSFGAAAGRAVARLILNGVKEFPPCLAASRML